MVRLHGREKVRAFAADLLRRRGDRQPPVLIFVGPDGSGKTAVLDHIEEEIDQVLPYARIASGSLGTATVPKITLALAFEFNRQCGSLGNLPCERLIVGQLVMNASPLPEGPDRAKARADVQRILEDHRNRAAMLETLLRVVITALPLAGVPVSEDTAGIAKVLPGLVLRGLNRTRYGRKISLGAGQDWYGSRHGNSGTAALDELVELNKRFHDYEQHHEWVDQTLLEALLFDLEAAFRRGRLAKSEFGCAILIDDADSPESLDFLTKFVQACANYTGLTGNAPPVAVIATSRGALAQQVAPDSRPYPSVRDSALRERIRTTTERWLPVWLSDLTQDEVELMASAKGLHGHVPTMIHRLTAGNPRATDRLLTAAAEYPDDAGDLGRLLDLPHAAAAPRPTIGERLYESFLKDLDDAVREHLVTTAAARDRREAEQLAPPPGLRPETNAAAALTADVWQDTDDGRTVVLPPLLHRLLSRSLAGRTSTALPDWEFAHRRLRPDAPWDTLNTEDQIRDLYHALAIGDLRHVTRRLGVALTSMPADEWLARLRTLVSAPRHSPAVDAPADEAEKLAADVPPDHVDELNESARELATLIAGLWIAADPFTGAARRELHVLIAAGYNAVAGFCPEGRIRLNVEAERHSTEARRWPSRADRNDGGVL